MNMIDVMRAKAEIGLADLESSFAKIKRNQEKRIIADFLKVSAEYLKASEEKKMSSNFDSELDEVFPVDFDDYEYELYGE